jgi:hypothetical protein
MLVYDREISLGTPAYFALDFDGDRVVSIHDFLYARYAMDGVDLSPLNPKTLSQTSRGSLKQLQHIARIVTRFPRLSTLSTLEAEFRQHCCHQGQSVSNLLDSTECCNLGPFQYPC